LLSAADVSFAYDRPTRTVLHGVSLHADRGAIVGIIGPNGSGKTTLLKVLAGTLRPAGGRVTLDGRPLAAHGRRALARRIAVVPQDTHAAFEYTAFEIVLMGRHPHLGAFELEGPRDVAAARDALEATGAGDLETRMFSTLSGGERQRVIIASALAQSAEILLLDEPTAALDLRYQIQVADLVTRLNRDRGITIVLSTHDLNFAASVCREIVMIRDGRLVAQGPARDVLTPGNVRTVYDVDADVRWHDAAGHAVVIPIGAVH
jgi:ABC-type cobalamin/Fe3+-siderophores transport system ATPase subunit